MICLYDALLIFVDGNSIIVDSDIEHPVNASLSILILFLWQSYTSRGPLTIKLIAQGFHILKQNIYKNLFSYWKWCSKVNFRF